MNLPWDGSFIGKISSQDMIYINTILGYRFYDIRLENSLLRCMAKQIANALPSIFDEIKQIFAISKIGTHRIKCNGKLYLLIHESRVFSDKLSKIQDLTDSNNNDIRKIFIYREIVGLRSTHRGSIRLYQDEVLSFVENSMVLDVHKSVLPKSSVKKWFKEITVDDELRAIMNNKTSQILRWEIEKIVNRIDKNFIWIVGIIIERLLLRIE